MTPAIIAALTRRSFRYASEDDLQRGIAAALLEDSIEFEREVRLSQRDRIDFMAGAVGIEVKTAGPLSALTAQLLRYASFERVGELVLVSGQYRLGNLPSRIGGKPLTVITLPRVFQ